MSTTSDTHEDNGKMFVGGLSWETSQEALTRYFSDFGEVVDCVVMKNGETGRSRGFGFVTFKDSACVQTVIASPPHTLDGRTIDPKSCNPRSQQQRSVRRESQPRKGDTPKIFLGGLPSTINETELSSHFSTYGKVVEVVIMYDQEKKRSRGFGFVSFETDDSVDRVCAERYIVINGKQVEAKRAEPRDGNMRGGGGGGGRGGGGRYNDNWNGNGGMSHHHGGPPMDNGASAPYQSGGWGPPVPQGYSAQGSYGSPPGGYQGWGVQPSPYGPYAAQPPYVQPPAYAAPGYGYGYGWPGVPGAPAQVGIPAPGPVPPSNGAGLVANGDQYGTPPAADYGAATAPSTHAPPPAPAGPQKSPKQDYNSYSTNSYGSESYSQDAQSYGPSRSRGGQDGYTTGSGDGSNQSGGRSGSHSQGGYHPYRRQ